jgi:class 3 adenylate cyclase
VNQFLGDGFMALFGAPVAHEDHARRAVLAAIGLQRTLKDHHTDLGGSIRRRVCIPYWHQHRHGGGRGDWR